jgi:hypothetical protein
VSGERAHPGLAEVAVVGVVVPVGPAVGWVVEAAVGLVVGTDEGLEEDAAAVWSALRDVQPVMARAATTTAVAMIRTGRMVIPPNSYDPSGPGQQPSPGRSQHGRRSASRRPRTGLNPVAIVQPMSTMPTAAGDRRAAPGRRARPVPLRPHRDPAAPAPGRGPRRAGPPPGPGNRPGRAVGPPARPELPRHDGRRGRLVVRPGLSRLLRAIGREVTTVPLLECPWTPDCPCDDCPPGCC